MTWTCFYDMHSGGGNKEMFDIINIEAPKDEAIVVFYNRFGHSPGRVSCPCCGPDYAVLESDIKERGRQRNRVLDIYAVNIKPEERIGTVPVQGYVWRD